MTNEKKNNIFKAIADPTRREIIHLLLMTTTALSINQIAEQFPISRQGVAKHIRVLNEAGLIDIIDKGRERYCYADPKPIKEIYDWAGYYSKFWEHKLNSLEDFLDQLGEV